MKKLVLVLLAALMILLSSGIAYSLTAPSSLTATAVSPNSIMLGWKDTNKTETGYEIQRKTGLCGSANPWATITTTTANVSTYTSAGLAASMQYSYRARAADGAVVSTYSNCATAKTGIQGTAVAPSAVVAISVTADEVSLRWSHDHANVTGFRIFRRAGTGAWTMLADAAAASENYRDMTAIGNDAVTAYSYYVKALNAAGASPASNIAILPFKPSSLTAAKTAQGVTLNWQDKSSNETSFRLWRRAGSCASGEEWRLEFAIQQNLTTYTDTTATGQVSYQVRSRVDSRAVPVAAGASGFSNCVEISAGGGAVLLPETGQRLCYDAAGSMIPCAGTGQDGALRKGAAWPNPRFASGTGDSADCVTDRLTGLMWPKNANLADASLTWQEALDYANDLALCGYADWQLPNRKELMSLMGYSEVLPADHLFTNVDAMRWYWSSTTHAGYPNNAWMVRMRDGLNFLLKGYSSHVWPVRPGNIGGTISLPQTGQKTCYDRTGNVISCTGTGQDGDSGKGIAWPSPRFEPGTGAAADCMLDRLTGLMWPKDATVGGGARTWQEALDAANGLAFCGYSDWRLPNVVELESLVNAEEADLVAWLNAQGFMNMQADWYWTSTSNVAGANYAWYLDLYYGYVYYYFKPYPYHVWPVRGGR